MSPVWVVVLVTVSLGQMVRAGHCGHKCKIDLCLVADESGSVDLFNDVKTFLHNLVSGLVVGPEDIQVGLVKFNGTGTLLFDLDAKPTKQQVLNGIDGMKQYNGSTMISAGINTTTDECFGGERAGVENIMVVVTDGKSTVGGDNIAGAVAKAKAAGITILVVGVKNPNTATIDLIGSGIDDNIFYVEPPTVAGPGPRYTFETAVPAVNKRLRDFCHICELDLCLVVDESGSISGNDNIFDDVKGFLVNLMDELDIGLAAVRVGLVVFNQTARVIFDLKTNVNPTDVKNGINGVDPQEGATKLSAGINTARTGCFNGNITGDRAGVPNVILMVTDGKPTVGGDDYKDAADDARDEGIEIIVVGVKNPNTDKIKEIAGGILANVFDADNNTLATHNFTTIVPALENRLMMLCNICELDICLVVDKSGSISVFNDVKTFLMDLMDGLDIGISAIRVGLVTFDSAGYLEFHLDIKTTKAGVIAGINGLGSPGGSTKVSSGINTATTQCFDPYHGDRKSAPNLMLVVTDGKSTVGGDNVTAAAIEARDAGITIIGIGVKNPNIPTMNIIVNNLQANIFLTDPLGVYNVTTLVPAVTNHLLSFCLICRVDVCFVLDESGSVITFAAVKQFVKDFVAVMNVGPTGTRVGVVTFNSTGYLRFDLNDHFTKSGVLGAIDAIMPNGGSTRISTGIEKARTECFGTANGDREDAQNVMYVITDGKPTVFPDPVKDAADDARGDGIAVIGIGVRNPNMPTIDVIAGDIPDHIFDADADYNSGTFADPDYTPLVPAMKANYLTFCHSLCLADVCFVIDESGSVNTWNQIKNFMINFALTQNIGPFGTQVAAVEFNSIGNPTFDLVEYLTAADVVSGITNDMSQSQGSTNIASGINKGVSYCFGPGNGHRSNARRVMIVVTDGKNTVGGAPDPIAAANDARAVDIEVIAIGVDNPNWPVITGISGPSSHAFNASDFTTLDDDVADLYEVLCHTMCRFDMCFLIDASGSVGTTHHALAIESMKTFVSAIDIGLHDNLVGVVQFHGDVHLEFEMNTHLNHLDLLNAIDGLQFLTGTTNITGGIIETRDFCFNQSSSGNAKFAHNVMFIMTDGGAMDKPQAVVEADATRAEGTDIVVMGAQSMDYDAAVLLALAGNVPENNFLATVAHANQWIPVTTGIIGWYYKNAQYQ